MANFGVFEKEVIITPVSRGGGGGYVPLRQGEKPYKYQVTIKVKFNNEETITTTHVTDYQANVIAKFNGIEKVSETEPVISINGVQVFRN